MLLSFVPPSTEEEARRDAGPTVARAGSRSRLSTVLVMVVTALVAGAPTLLAQSVDLVPVADATIYEPSPSLECSDPLVDLYANGGGTGLFVGRTAGSGGFSLRRSLLRFDVASAIPSGAIIESASLALTVNKVPQQVAGFTTELRMLDASWNEGSTTPLGAGGAGDSAMAGDVTWCDRESGVAEWSVGGGDFGVEVIGSVLMTDLGTYVVPTSPAMVAAVQSWLDDPLGNHGWLLRGGEGFGTPSAKRLGSREDDEDGPVLTVSYSLPQTSALEVPVGGGAAGLLLALTLAILGVRWMRG